MQWLTKLETAGLRTKRQTAGQSKLEEAAGTGYFFSRTKEQTRSTAGVVTTFFTTATSALVKRMPDYT